VHIKSLHITIIIISFQPSGDAFGAGRVAFSSVGTKNWYGKWVSLNYAVTLLSKKWDGIVRPCRCRTIGATATVSGLK